MPAHVFVDALGDHIFAGESADAMRVLRFQVPHTTVRIAPVGQPGLEAGDISVDDLVALVNFLSVLMQECQREGLKMLPKFEDLL